MLLNAGSQDGRVTWSVGDRPALYIDEVAVTLLE